MITATITTTADDLVSTLDARMLHCMTCACMNANTRPKVAACYVFRAMECLHLLYTLNAVEYSDWFEIQQCMMMSSLVPADCLDFMPFY